MSENEKQTNKNPHTQKKQNTNEKTNLNIVSGEDAPQVEHLQHGGGAVVGDAVALQNIFGDQNLPGQPALTEGSVEGQDVREVARLAAAAALVFLHSFGDGLHFPLLAVST